MTQPARCMMKLLLTRSPLLLLLLLALPLWDMKVLSQASAERHAAISGPLYSKIYQQEHSPAQVMGLQHGNKHLNKNRITKNKRACFFSVFCSQSRFLNVDCAMMVETI